MIRVLHIFNFFDQGGIENFVMNVYRNIDRSKIQFDFAFIENKKGYFDDEAKQLGANIYFFDSDEKTIKNYSRNLERIIKTYGPFNAVHSHCYFFSGIFLKVAKKCGVPIRISHSHDTKKGRKETILRKIYENMMRKEIKKNATIKLACSDMAGKYLFGEKEEFTTLYNGINLNVFRYIDEYRREIREKLQISLDSLVLLNVGRFADQKNHHYILDIFEKVKESNDNAKLVLIGTGPLEEEIRARVKEDKIEEDVIFLSNIKDTYKYYCAADFFILPSKYEGMSIVSVESQAIGVSTLVSNEVPKEITVTDLIEYFDIKDENLKEWVNAIETNKNKQISREDYYKKIIDTPFDINETVKKLSLIYSGEK